METSDDNKYRQFAEIIREKLRNGIALSEEAVHFIDSTFSTTSTETLQEMIAEEADGELEVLYSLIFFPDSALQEELEPVIEKYRFHQRDVPTIVTHLNDMRPETTVHFPDNRGKLHLSMSETAAGQFVTRLHISRQLDHRLVEGIHRYRPEETASLTKVKLRNTRFEMSENRISFLCEFFEKMNDQDGTYLDLMHSVFEESRDSSYIYDWLQSKKKRCFQNIQKAKRYQEMLNTYNMETLMLRGIRIPHIEIDEEQKKIHLIDGVSHAVYGKTEHIPPTEDMLEFTSDANLSPSHDGSGQRRG